MSGYLIQLLCAFAIAKTATVGVSKSQVGYIFFVYTLLASTVFYGVLGTWYWAEYRGGEFVGAVWQNELRASSAQYLLCFALVVFALRVCLSFVGAARFEMRGGNSSGGKDVYFSGLLAIGAICCIYTLLIGGQVKSDAASVTADPFLLIAYQFSDLPIALILVGLGVGRRARHWMLVALLYSIYAFLVGFRYRLVLLWAPIIAAWFAASPSAMSSKLLRLALSGSIMALIFSLLTVTRSKFSGVDADAFSTLDGETILYGFFAETNVIFGWVAAKNAFGNIYPYIGFTPVWETFTQFIPRFLFQDKALYQHLWDVNFAIAGTEESRMSGTAMPYFGEYYAMGGWFGLYFGLVVYSAFVAAAIDFCRRNSYSLWQYGMSAGLMATYMAYYYFGRGSISQVGKGVLFVIFPYMYFLRCQTRLRSL